MTTVAETTSGTSVADITVVPEVAATPVVRLPAIQVDEAQIQKHLDGLLLLACKLADLQRARLCGRFRWFAASVPRRLSRG